MMTDDRGTGQTTQQIIDSQHGGFFVACGSRHARYVRRLCHHLGRTDIEIRTPSWLEDKVRGHRFSPGQVVYDHNFWPENDWQLIGMQIVKARTRRGVSDEV